MLLIRLNLKKRRDCRKKSRRDEWLAFYLDQLVRATTNLSRSCLANSWAATATGLPESEGRGGQPEPGSAKRG